VSPRTPTIPSGCVGVRGLTPTYGDFITADR